MTSIRQQFSSLCRSCLTAQASILGGIGGFIVCWVHLLKADACLLLLCLLKPSAT
jgi:hypothetical protein